MIPIVRACVDPMYRRVIVVTGSQMGKTDNLLNVIGQKLDDDPAPMLYVGPTKSNVEKVIEPRIMKMINFCPDLKRKLSKGRKGSKTHKTIAGVSLRLAWAGSATELASQDACIVEVDELDRMSTNVEGEGSPFEIAEARTFTYPDGKAIATSTCTIGNVDEEYDPKTRLTRWAVANVEDIQSPIWKLWQSGTRFEFAWPCPSCHEYFIPRFSLLVWPEKATIHEVGKQARVQCPHCKYRISDNHKTEMNERGVFVAPGQWIDRKGVVHGEVEPNDTASFWVSGLCSPWVSFGRRAKAFVEADRSGEPEKIQVALNTQFGELYKVGGTAKPWEDARALIGSYTPDAPPEGIRVITMGVDVQKDRLIWAVRGWGYNLESWGLGSGTIWGETEFNAPWTELQELIDTATFGGMPIRLIGIDSGYRPGEKHRTPTNMVYAFCYRNRARVIPTKGHDEMDKPIHRSLIDVTIGGKLYKSGLQLWHLNTDYFKGWVTGRLDWPVNEPGAFHLPEGTTDDFLQELCSEARIVKPSGKPIWVKVRRNNHIFDVETINAALAHILQVQHMKPRPENVIKSFPVDKPVAPTEPKAGPPKAQQVQPRRRKSSYMNRG